MSIAYVVTKGDYSDYRILGVFLKKEEAEEAKKWHAADSIEEWEIGAIPPHPPGMYWYEVVMNRDGAVDNVRICDGGDGWCLHEKWEPSRLDCQ